MDATGVKCIYVEGNTKENDDSTYNSHAWNMVYLDDGWYIVDLAYDHPETTSGKNVLIYDYFNITSDEASDLNPASDWLPGIPTCTGFDKILDKYGVSVVLISLGVIIILIVTLVKRIHKRRKARRVEKIKNTKTVTIDHSELDEELRRPPLS